MSAYTLRYRLADDAPWLPVPNAPDTLTKQEAHSKLWEFSADARRRGYTVEVQGFGAVITIRRGMSAAQVAMQPAVEQAQEWEWTA